MSSRPQPATHIPLTRSTVRKGPGDAHRRVELNRIRLYALGDLAEHWGSRPREAILEPWEEVLEELRANAKVDAVASARDARFGRERLYIKTEPAASVLGN
jgi:hypothetical protein